MTTITEGIIRSSLQKEWEIMAKKIIPNNRRRTCRYVGCKHKLSIYNHEVYCYVHQQLALGKSSSAPVPYQHYFQELAVKP